MLILDYIFIFSAISHILKISVIIYNFLTAPKNNCKIKGIHPLPGISILIPVRDEEKNIEKLISSI